MNDDRFDHELYRSGLTAQGCWDNLDDYAREAILLFGQLIVQECIDYAFANGDNVDYLKQYFGVEE